MSELRVMVALCALAACAGDDVVARRIPGCPGAGCAPSIDVCTPSVCAEDACASDAPWIRAADACDALGAPLPWNTLCVCADVNAQSDVRVLAGESGAPVSVSVLGRIANEGSFAVAGALYSAEDPARPGSVDAERVSTAAACSCAPAQLLDFDVPFAAAGGELRSRELDGFSGTRTLSLECGTRVLERIAGSGELTIEASGHSVLLVDGNIELDQGLDVRLAGGATLELVVRGSVRVAGAVKLGDPAGTLRMYVGTSGTIDLRGSVTMYGALYAPAAELVLAGTGELHGRVFVRRLAASGVLDFYAGDVGAPLQACESTRAAASSPLFTASGMPTP